MLDLRRLVPTRKHRASIHDLILEKASREAEAGRRLVMYDRVSGLFAYWYAEKRIAEELRRAERYGHALTIMVVEAARSEGFGSFDRIADWLSRHLRVCDLATHLGGGRYLVLLPETAVDAAGVIAERLRAEFPDVAAVGLGSFPGDGATLNELRAAAERTLASAGAAV